MDTRQAQDMPQVHVMPSDQLSEPLDPIAEAITQMDTIPLAKRESREKVNWHFVACSLLMFFAAFGASLWYALTYPTVTVSIVPVEKSLALIVPLHVFLRHLAPITLTESLSANTTGKGHQDAIRAAGTLTIYNGEFTSETVAAGTVFTGKDGVQVATDRFITIPAANPPYFGWASVPAHAIKAGAVGNIQAGDINKACCFLSVQVKNAAPFNGGVDERDYRAVAQVDVDTRASELKKRFLSK